ncbi:MAG: hypothetical protein R3234_11585 [Thermoanaerobaculia bacterium]|nr:hypothetical protein [Thermoanaerobaculia bacterium]
MILDFVRQRVVASERMQQAVLALATLGSFSWLLVQDQIHPLVVYLLQLYLAF